MKDAFSEWVARLTVLLRSVGPYAAICLLLPGGSIISLIVWVCRHRQNLGTHLRFATVPQRPRWFPLLLGASLLFCGVTLTACGGHAASAPTPHPVDVTVVTLKPQPVTITTELPGRTSSFRVAEVRPQVSGVLLKRLFMAPPVISSQASLPAAPGVGASLPRSTCRSSPAAPTSRI